MPDFEFVNAIHPSVITGKNVKLGVGIVMMAGCIINPNCEIGDFSHRGRPLIEPWQSWLVPSGAVGIELAQSALAGVKDRSDGARGQHPDLPRKARVETADERLLPNVVQTARAIWLISLTWLGVGWVALAVVGLLLGQEPMRAVLHGLWVFMGGWSTGGFAPMSYNTFYYHSIVYELVTIVVFVAGSLNFALHWAVWSGRKNELRRNIETLSFAVTLTGLVALGTWALMRLGIYPEAVALFRKSFYQVVSGHTTTGFSTIYSRAFVSQWGDLAMLAVTIAMAIGASACSTAGGIKGLRVGLISKAFLLEVRKALSPPSAVVVERYHHVRRTILTGFAVLLIAALCFWLTVHLPAADFYDGQESFETVAGVVPQFLAAGLAGYVVGEFLNSWVLVKMKERSGEKRLWARLFSSTLVGEFFDTLVFCSIAASALGISTWSDFINYALIGFVWKTLVEVAIMPLTYLVVGWLKSREPSYRTALAQQGTIR